MKHHYFYILLLSLFLYTSGTMAQGKMDKNRINLLKISFITEQIELSPEEAQQFWPVYNKYNDKIHGARQELERGIQREIKQAGGIDNLSDEQSDEIMQRSIALEETISSNKIALNKELRTVISSKKILKLHMAEREFNRRMLQEYGKRKRFN